MDDVFRQRSEAIPRPTRVTIVKREIVYQGWENVWESSSGPALVSFSVSMQSDKHGAMLKLAAIAYCL